MDVVNDNTMSTQTVTVPISETKSDKEMKTSTDNLLLSSSKEMPPPKDVVSPRELQKKTPIALNDQGSLTKESASRRTSPRKPTVAPNYAQVRNRSNMHQQNLLSTFSVTTSPTQNKKKEYHKRKTSDSKSIMSKKKSRKTVIDELMENYMQGNNNDKESTCGGDDETDTITVNCEIDDESSLPNVINLNELELDDENDLSGVIPINAKQDMIEKYNLEKNLVNLTDRPGNRSGFAAVWRYGCFRIASLKDNWQTLVVEKDIRKYPGISKIIMSPNGVCVCVLCYNNPVLPLLKSVFATSKGLNPSNLTKHMRTKHEEDESPQFFKTISVGQGKAAILPKSPDELSKITESTYRVQKKSIQDHFTEYSATIALDIWSRKAHKFFNKCGIPFRSADSLEFRDLMSFTIQQANALKPSQSKLYLGHTKFSNISRKKLEELTFVVNRLVAESNEYFLRLCGKKIPRLCLAHDIWESKNGHWLGMSLFIMDVQLWKLVVIPIGFKRSHGKKAVEVALQIENALLKFNVNFSDIFRGISDNTTSAIAASKLISEGRVGHNQKIYCMMHTVDLAVKHGLGILVRKKNKQIVDDSPELLSLRTKLKDMCSYIMDKHNKGRFKELQTIAQENYSCACVRLEIPNATRVAGFYRMMQGALRNKTLIDIATVNEPKLLVDIKTKVLNENDWKDVADIEAILSKMTVLNMNMQSDLPGRQSLTCYEIYATKKCLFDDDTTFNCIDTTKMWRPDLPFADLPRVTCTINEMRNIGKIFLNRLKKEFDFYLTNMDDDMKVATMVNPVTGSMGLAWINDFNEDLELDIIEDYKTSLLKMMCSMFEDTIVEGLKKIEQPVTHIDEDKTALNVNRLSSKSNGPNDFLLKQLQKRDVIQKRTNEMAETEYKMKALAKLKQEVTMYYDFITQMNYVMLLKKYKSEGTDIEDLDEYTIQVLKDPMYTASKFDVFEWWRDFGQRTWPHIAACALVIFSKPQHNGFQERVFSRGTFTDDQLRRNMKETTFEISILEALNCNMVEKYMELWNNVESTEVTESIKKETAKQFLTMQTKTSTTIEIDIDTDENDEEEIGEVDDFCNNDSEDEYMSEEEK